MAMAPMAAVLLLFVLAAPAVHSLQYNVPWSLGISYNTWGAGKTFNVGDTLVFVYTAEHSVDVVDQTDYASCNSGSPLGSYSGGKTTITLTTPGPIYFLCPTEGHCLAGMKLSITVAGTSPAPTIAPATPPTALTTSPTTSPSASPSPSPAVKSPSVSPSSVPSPATSITPVAAASSPKSSSGAGRMVGDMNDLVVIAVSVVVAGFLMV